RFGRRGRGRRRGWASCWFSVGPTWFDLSLIVGATLCSSVAPFGDGHTGALPGWNRYAAAKGKGPLAAGPGRRELGLSRCQRLSCAGEAPTEKVSVSEL